MFKTIVQFILCTLLIYTCYIISGIYHQKLLKNHYLNSNGETNQFQFPIIFTFFPQVISAIIGYICLVYMKKVHSIQPVKIPFSKAIICGIIINICMATYNKAVMQASFPAVVMVKSCSLLSVVIVGIFFSRVKDKQLKLGISKIWIGIIVTIGIILFNFFKIVEKGNDKPITWTSSLLLFISLFGDGLLPDFQAEIKSLYNPSVMDMYFSINRCTAIVALIYATLTLQVPYIINFIIEHKQFQTDLLFFSILNAMGQLVIYKMIKLFKQHIPSFVIATRKCFTVMINIIHFDHKINIYQMFGMSLVFSGVMLEVYENYKQKKQKQLGKISVNTTEPTSENDIDSHRLNSPTAIEVQSQQLNSKNLVLQK